MRYWSFLLLAVLRMAPGYAQIGAEAQGGKMTTWLALGLDQRLSERWVSVTDIGYGRHSDPDNLQFLKRQGLFVVTQDFIYRINSHWRVATSFGYWNRSYYDDLPPYDARTSDSYRNELRPFQRLYYDHRMGNVLVTQTFRADYRFYWTPGYTERWPTPFEFRARYMINVKIPITNDKLNWIIFNDEALSAVDKYNASDVALQGKNWSDYKFTENRFSVYYRRRLEHLWADLDVGLMHQYWREVKQAGFTNSFNIMIDLMIYDPFGKNKKE